MFKTIIDWWYNVIPVDIAQQERIKVLKADQEFLDKLELPKNVESIFYPLIHDSNREFVLSLNKRQAEYYFTTDKRSQALTLLEQRIYELEQQLLKTKEN